MLPTYAVLSLAAVLLIGYFGSFGFFLAKNKDFIAENRIDRLTPRALPLTLRLTNEQPKALELVAGWSHPEPTATWTERRHVQTSIVSQSLIQGERYRVSFDVKAAYVVHRKRPLTTTLSINGEIVNTRIIDTNSPFVLEQEFTFHSQGSRLDIEVEIDGLTSPFSNGESGDRRKLGLYVSKISVEPLK